jgi:peptidoglycan hydrolase CwlO-like protein
MLRTSKSALESVDYHRKVIGACENMLKQIDPEYAKQQERDDTIDSLKNEVSSLKGDVSRILDLLTKAGTSQT